MTKILSLLLGVLLLASCAEQYNMAGNSSVAYLDGQMLYLRVDDGRNMKKKKDVDSCQVIHGQFSFYGDVDSVMLAQLYMGDESVMPVVIENGNMDVLLDNARQRVSGSPLNDRLYKFLQAKERLDNEMWEIEQSYIRMMRQGLSPLEMSEEIGEKRALLNKKMEALETDFVTSNFNNVLGPGFFMIICSQYPVPIMTEQIKKILKKAPESFKKHPFVSSYIQNATYEMTDGENAKH